MYRKTYVEINVHNLKHNLDQLRRQLSPGQFFCPMIKSNAYGHGDVPFARFLSKNDVRTFGVALIEEALRLRFSGLDSEQILIFGAFDREGAQSIVAHKITPVIKLWSELENLTGALREQGLKDYPVHLKFNTGMNRLGFLPSDATKLSDFLQKSEDIKLEALCTHFLKGDDYGESGYCQQQLRAFAEVEKAFSRQVPFVKHVYNSAAFEASALRGQQQDWGVRPGLALYGISSLEASSVFDLRPAMRLCSQLIAVQRVKKGETVSYGARWTADCDSVIGVVPIGYADGYSYQFSNCGVITFRGQRVPVVGSVCMDYILVDLSKVLSNDLGCEGEEVIIFGDPERGELSVSEAASLIGTIPYELMTSIGRRVPCQYVGE